MTMVGTLTGTAVVAGGVIVLTPFVAAAAAVSATATMVVGGVLVVGGTAALIWNGSQIVDGYLTGTIYEFNDGLWDWGIHEREISDDELNFRFGMSISEVAGIYTSAVNKGGRELVTKYFNKAYKFAGKKVLPYVSFRQASTDLKIL